MWFAATCIRFGTWQYNCDQLGLCAQEEVLVDSDCWDLLSSKRGEKFVRFDRLFVSALCTVQAR